MHAISTSNDAIIVSGGAMRTTLCPRRRSGTACPKEFYRRHRKDGACSRSAEVSDRARRAPAGWLRWAAQCRDSKIFPRRRVNQEWILADTSVWIDHLRSNNSEIAKAARKRADSDASICRGRTGFGFTLEPGQDARIFLTLLPQARMAQLSEVRQMIESRPLL